MPLDVPRIESDARYEDLVASDVLVSSVAGLAKTIKANGYLYPRLEQIDREALDDQVGELNTALKFWKEKSTPGGFLIMQLLDGCETKDHERLKEYKSLVEGFYTIPAERVTGLSVLSFGGNPVVDARIQASHDLHIDQESKWSVATSPGLITSVENSGRWIRLPLESISLRTVTGINRT